MRLVAASAVATLLISAGTNTARERWIEPETGMVFVKIDGGRFIMGSPRQEPGREAQERQHLVRLSGSFWLGAFEVTQDQWRDVMGNNPSWSRDGDGARPIENVTWYDVQEFLQRLAKRAGRDRFRLPTEAEWEYACRAGSETAYATGATLTAAQANVAGSPDTAARGQTMKVGSFSPNPWGLHDMHGNVWEWTDDDYCPYGQDAIDPRPQCRTELKVIRGGSWYFAADSARCALRYTHRPQDKGFSLGFRVVREPGSG